MPGVTITWDQRVALGRRLGIDPEDVDAGRVLREVGKLARRRERSYADTDPTRILKLDPDETRPIETTVPTDGRAFTDDEERALGDRLDDYMGIPTGDRVRAFESDGEIRDPTGLLDLR